jgi:glycosyltransferase involved in cell wall biosynthesis
MEIVAMEKIEEVRKVANAAAAKLPVSVIVAVRNEAKNLPRCLQALTDVGEVYVIDSQSTDETVEIARSCGAEVVQFHYQGGWPKKRQWAMNTLPIAYDWILLLDADEVLTPELSDEIRSVIQNPAIHGYSILLRTWFLGRVLRHGDVGLWKLSLFRRGKGRYECRLKDQDASMADMEVHEHVVVEGATARLRNPVIHYNVESLSRYIRKHDAYSNWEAKVWLDGNAGPDALSASLTGTQAQRRRWLRRKFFALPGSPLVFFLYRYVFRLGFLDGIPGFIYSCFQGIQFFHIKAKIYELQQRSGD